MKGDYYGQSREFETISGIFLIGSNHNSKSPSKISILQKYTEVHSTKKPVTTMRSGNNQSVGSSAPVVSRCFPGGYNVKLYISRGRLAWWLLAFLHSDLMCELHQLCGKNTDNFLQMGSILLDKYRNFLQNRYPPCRKKYRNFVEKKVPISRKKYRTFLENFCNQISPYKINMYCTFYFSTTKFNLI